MPAPYALTPDKMVRELRRIAPDIDIETVWEVDPYFEWDGDGPDPALEGYVPHNVTVKATSLVEDYPAKGDAHLGGVYVEPGEPDPMVHGYFPGMLLEALETYYIELTGESPRARKGRKDWDPREKDPREGLDAEALQAIDFVRRSIHEIRLRERRRR